MSPPLISAQGPIPCPGLPRVQCGISEGRHRMGFEGTQSDLCSLAGEWEDPFSLGYGGDGTRDRVISRAPGQVVKPSPTSWRILHCPCPKLCVPKLQGR